MSLWLYLDKDGLDSLVTQKSDTEAALSAGFGSFTNVDPVQVTIQRTDPEMTDEPAEPARRVLHGVESAGSVLDSQDDEEIEGFSPSVTEMSNRSIVLSALREKRVRESPDQDAKSGGEGPAGGSGRRLTNYDLTNADAQASEDLGLLEIVFALDFLNEPRYDVHERLQETKVSQILTELLSGIMTKSLASLSNNSTVIAVMSDVKGSNLMSPAELQTVVVSGTGIPTVVEVVTVNQVVERGVWEKPQLYLASSGIALLGFAVILIGSRIYADEKANAVIPIEKRKEPGRIYHKDESPRGREGPRLGSLR